MTQDTGAPAHHQAIVCGLCRGWGWTKLGIDQLDDVCPKCDGLGFFPLLGYKRECSRLEWSRITDNIIARHEARMRGRL